MIPAALGNRTLFTNEECDECNNLFGKTSENELVNSLLAYRALWGLRSREAGIKHFPRPHLEPRSGITNPGEGGEVRVQAFAHDDSLVLVEQDDGPPLLRVRAPRYRPYLVAQALVRMAVLVLPLGDAEEIRLRLWMRGAVPWLPRYVRFLVPGRADPEFHLNVWRSGDEDYPMLIEFGTGDLVHVLPVPGASWRLPAMPSVEFESARCHHPTTLQFENIVVKSRDHTLPGSVTFAFGGEWQRLENEIVVASGTAR